MPVNPVTQEEQPALFSEFDIKINRASVGMTALRVSDAWLTNGTWAVKRTRVSNQTIFTCACCLQRDTGAFTLTPIEDYFVEGMLNPDDVMERWARTDTQVEVSGIDFTRYQSDAGQICYVRRSYQEHFHLGYLYGDRPEDGLWDKPSLFDASVVIAAHREPQHMRLPLRDLLEASQTSLYAGNDTPPADAPLLTAQQVEELEYEHRQLADASFPGIPQVRRRLFSAEVVDRYISPGVRALLDEPNAVRALLDEPNATESRGDSVAVDEERSIREVDTLTTAMPGQTGLPLEIWELMQNADTIPLVRHALERVTSNETRRLIGDIQIGSEWHLPMEVGVYVRTTDPTLDDYLPVDFGLWLYVGYEFESGQYRGQTIIEMIVTFNSLYSDRVASPYGITNLTIKTDEGRWLQIYRVIDHTTMQFVDAPQEREQSVPVDEVDFTLEADATQEASQSAYFPAPTYDQNIDPVVVSEDLFNRLRTSAGNVNINDVSTWRVNRVSNIRIVPLVADDNEGVVIALRATTESSARNLGGAIRAVRSGNSTLWVSENSPRMFIALNDDDESRRDWMVEVEGHETPFKVVFMPDWTSTTHYVAVFITELNSVVRYVEQTRLAERTNTAVRALLKEIVVEVLAEL